MQTITALAGVDNDYSGAIMYGMKKVAAIDTLLGTKMMPNIDPSELQDNQEDDHDRHEHSILDSPAEVKRHLADLLLEKILTNSKLFGHLDNIPSRESLKANRVSLLGIVSDIRKINSRTYILGKASMYLALLISWAQPAYTLSGLFIYTYLCLHPNLILVLPIAGILLGVMVPGYQERHPFPDQYLPRRPTWRNDAYDEDLKLIQETKKKKNVTEILADVQNSLDELVKTMDKVEAFYYGAGSFVDENHSSAIFILLTITLFVVGFASQYLPMNLGIVIIGWTVVIANHPDLRDKVKELRTAYLKAHEHDLEEFIHTFEQEEIVDSEAEDEEESKNKLVAHATTNETPVVSPVLTHIEDMRDVEVFELQKQGLTPEMWQKWVYSPEMYDERSLLRLSQERPPGTEELDEIAAPPGWFFDDAFPWYLDEHTKTWIAERAVRHVEMDVDDHWAYDYNIEKGERGEWRRRRWLRPCFRSSLPPRSKT